jgi:hypothetical protein
VLIVAGSVRRSKSRLLMSPEAIAASRTVMPSLCAWWAMAAARLRTRLNEGTSVRVSVNDLVLKAVAGPTSVSQP